MKQKYEGFRGYLVGPGQVLVLNLLKGPWSNPDLYHTVYKWIVISIGIFDCFLILSFMNSLSSPIELNFHENF